MDIETYANTILNELSVHDKSHMITIGDNDELALLHHSLGQYIRNKFKLWSVSWTPELVDGIDYSPNHPDAVSFKVIENIYNMLKQHPQSGTVSVILSNLGD